MSDQFNTGPGYTPMPGDPGRGPVVRGPAPSSVLTAVRLMFVRAALSAVGVIVVLATKSTLKDQILKKNPTYDASKLDSALNVALAVGVVIGIIFIVLYILLALQVGKGKNWARIVTWVLAGLGVLGVLASLAQTEPALSRIVSLITGIVDIAIIVFLALRPSSEYFSQTP